MSKSQIRQTERLRQVITEPLGPTSITQPGTTIGLGCQKCELLDICGGVFSDHDCMGSCHECNPSTCTMACPRNQNWVGVLRDAGGFEIGRHMNIKQGISTRPPLYVPHIANGSGRSKNLMVPFSALTTFDVARALSSGLFSTAKGLRNHFRLGRSAQIILLSIEKDKHLERFWQYLKERRYAERLTALGITYITAPNFSFALDAPRPEHLVNRIRSLRCAEYFTRAGLNVIPHLNAYNDNDYAFWLDFLREHANLSIIALEFQTGLSTVKKAKWHISKLLDIQQSLGRDLHLVAVGGRKHLHMLTAFGGISIIDSVPFIRTIKRRRLELSGGKWSFAQTKAQESLHSLLNHNVIGYSKLIDARFEKLKMPANVITKIPAMPYQPDPKQLSFWPERLAQHLSA